MTSHTEKSPKPILLVNGQPVYPRPLPDTPITEAEVEAVARQLTGDAEVARAWMDRPNLDFDGQTPRQAVQSGEG
ncbi:hypothetical protein Dxin01_03354 [Deinococcus xinjiangensis]|uniref:Antitoxin Xre/MbcA/ParS-like toxin-binding domain-containing protein n=1 Tax=Deinococcus xinjiangensis TaxID=457454 RepID=A0ABP9VEF2_9DEIO